MGKFYTKTKLSIYNFIEYDYRYDFFWRIATERFEEGKFRIIKFRSFEALEDG